jgi:hypothetical protein
MRQRQSFAIILIGKSILLREGLSRILRRVKLLGWDKSRREVPVSVMADVCLGITVAGLYTLVGMGLVIVFM